MSGGEGKEGMGLRINFILCFIGQYFKIDDKG